MAGLLGDGWDSPQSQGLLALASGMIQGNFGKGVSDYGTTMASAQEREMRRKFEQMRMEQAQEEMLLAKQDREGRAYDSAAIRRSFSPIQGGDAMQNGQGPTLGNAANLGQIPAFNPRQFFSDNPQASPAALKQAIEMSQAMQPKVPKFSTAPQYDQNGRAFILAEDGSMKYLDGVKARDKLNEVRLGDKVGFRTDYSPELMGSMRIGQSPDSVASNQVSMRGQNMTDARARERFNFDKAGGVGAVNGANPVRQGPMSVTLQKELLESDDVAQSSSAIIDILTEGKKINKTAYSGYGAKPRAVLASNMPWDSAGADATINLDNMMTGQALESLKSIFGGMPTEGERKILLDMQASAEKTPAQREAIMDRAIAAAQRRGGFAAQKAKAIRGGTYLTEGIAQDEPAKPKADAMSKLPTANASNKGRRIKDTETGKILVSNGMTWVAQ